jgi:hypothetical protein
VPAATYAVQHIWNYSISSSAGQRNEGGRSRQTLSRLQVSERLEGLSTELIPAKANASLTRGHS